MARIDSTLDLIPVCSLRCVSTIRKMAPGVTTGVIASRGRIMHDARMPEFPPSSPCILSRSCRRNCTGRGGCKRSSEPGRCGTCGSFSSRRETRTPARERSRKVSYGTFARATCQFRNAVAPIPSPPPPLRLLLYPASGVPRCPPRDVINYATHSPGAKRFSPSAPVIFSPSREGG